MLKSQRCIVTAMLALICTVGLGTAHAANIVASETIADIATITGTQFDVTPFTSVSQGESADGSGAFQANTPATGMALVVLTEGLNGPNSDWIELVYTSTAGSSTQSLTVHWRSDADPGGLPALPAGVTPMFLVENGFSQDITTLLASSATASGFAFPSNITVQVQSDVEAVPEPASLVLLGTGLFGFRFVRGRKRT